MMLDFSAIYRPAAGVFLRLVSAGMGTTNHNVKWASLYIQFYNYKTSCIRFAQSYISEMELRFSNLPGLKKHMIIMMSEEATKLKFYTENIKFGLNIRF